MVTSLGSRICQSFNFTELLIDSTYKTNSQQLEMFGVISKVVVQGLLLGYLLLQLKAGETETGESLQKIALQSFFESLSNALPRLSPEFFFTDKDRSQMKTITNLFYINTSLCLWHIKRAFLKKIKDLKNRSQILHQLFNKTLLI